MIDYDAKVNSIRFESEREFATTFFDHDKWVHEPRFFYLPDGAKYKPDFYDAKRDVYIEVIGSRQAFAQNKEKYISMRESFSDICLEFRFPDGSLVDPGQAMSIAKRRLLPADAPDHIKNGQKPTFEEASAWLLSVSGSICQVAKWLKMSKNNTQRIFDMNESGSGVERTREWVCFKVQEHFLNSARAQA